MTIFYIIVPDTLAPENTIHGRVAIVLPRNSLEGNLSVTAYNVPLKLTYIKLDCLSLLPLTYIKMDCLSLLWNAYNVPLQLTYIISITTDLY